MSAHNDSRFWTHAKQAVGTESRLQDLGENGSVEWTMRGVGENLKGAFTALFAGSVRGITREQMVAFVRNVLDEGGRTSGTSGTSHAPTSPIHRVVSDLFVLCFHLRDCRGGKGEKDLSRWMFLELYDRYPKSARSLLPLLPEFGYWRDMSLLISDLMERPQSTRSTHSRGSRSAGNDILIEDIYKLMADQLRDDDATMCESVAGGGASAGEKPALSLLAKYIPKEGRSFDKRYKCAKRMAKLLFPTEFTDDFRKAMRLYRKLVTRLNSTIQTTEVLMSGNQWDKIQFRLVPGRLMRICQRAFLNLKGGKRAKGDEVRHPTDDVRIRCREHLLDHIGKAKEGKVKFHGNQNHPHEIVNSITEQSSYCHTMTDLTQAERDIAQLQWNSIRDAIIAEIDRKGLDVKRGMSLVDVSGSMAGEPMQAAVSLGILVSEMAPPPYGNSFITFHENPTLFELRPEWDLYDKVKHAYQAPWGGSTDFMAAMNLILEIAVTNRLAPDQLPSWLLVLSDMQFNTANGMTNAMSKYSSLRKFFTGTDTPAQRVSWATNHEILVEIFRNAGIQTCGQPYVLPRMVYWNLRGGVGFPVQADTPNTQMVSGFSPDLLTLVLENRVDDYEEVPDPTPWDVVVKVLEDERYAVVRDRLAASFGRTPAVTSPASSTAPAPPPSAPTASGWEVVSGGCLDDTSSDGSSTKSVKSTWTTTQLIDWLREQCAPEEVMEQVRKMKITGAVFDDVVSRKDHGSLDDLGLTNRMLQSKVMVQWKA